MMMNHDELQVANETNGNRARCIQCHAAATHNESRVCEECKEQDDIFYHGQKMSFAHKLAL